MKPLTRNEIRILRRAVASNGGGYDVTHEPDAPVRRLQERGFIRLKKGQRTGPLMVHTSDGLEFWRRHEAAAAAENERGIVAAGIA